MGHEIFLNIVAEPRNNFLCFPLVILIFKLRGVWAQNVQTGYQGDLLKNKAS